MNDHQQQDFLEFQHFLENDNPCYEMPTSRIILPMSPPDSCPVTPTSPEEENYDVNIPECRTDAPELEHYLKQTNPLQGMQPKRKCGWSLEKNEKVKAKKTKKEEKKKHQIKNEKIETSDVSSCRKVLKWNDYKREDCYKLYNSSLVEMESPSLLVTCDKGFTFSSTEDVFICQKKNHFQVTLVLKKPDAESYIKIEDVYQSITGYKVHLYAIKAESPHKKIAMEQSLADRSKLPYHPVKFPENSALTKTLTIGRLHFSETTSNNMRKKGKLNPDQRYFLLVVDVRAYTKQGNYSVGCQASEKLIVRASNPGQFENDVALWSKDKCGDSVYRMGHVGINNDKPEECLSVNGNLRLTGEVMQPSDVRLTDSIEMIDSRQHLENVCKMKLYKYRYSEEYVEHAGLNSDQQKGVGVLGHELKTLLPDAITEGSDMVLPDQRIIKDVLLVNKDRLLMESLGAVQELYKISKMLTSRLVELEAKNDILEICVKNMLPDAGILQ